MACAGLAGTGLRVCAGAAVFLHHLQKAQVLLLHVSLELADHGPESSDLFQISWTGFWGRHWQVGRPCLFPRPRRSQNGPGLGGWRLRAVFPFVVPQLFLLLGYY